MLHLLLRPSSISSLKALSVSQSLSLRSNRLGTCGRGTACCKQLRGAGATKEDLQAQRNAFKQAQKTVREFSKLKRAQFFEEQLRQAAVASEKGDVRTLHAIINRVAPRTRRPRPQIRNKEGKMVSPACELRIIKNFWQTVYTGNLPVALAEPGTITLDADRFANALAQLPAHKALPRHYVPSVAWKLASRPIADLLQRTVLRAGLVHA